MALAQRVTELTGAVRVQAIAGGHQSQVFEVTLVDRRRAVAKVLDAAYVDVDSVIARVDAVAQLAELDSRVCAPVPFEGGLVNAVDDGAGRPVLVVCYEFADGVAFDVMSSSDAELMGSTLAGLHRSLACLAPEGIPQLAALRAVTQSVGEAQIQLLHGDFNSGNLRRSGSTVRVFDFEDCGFGPRTFEIANTLYMELFAATIDNQIDRYKPFEDAFLRGYATQDSEHIDRAAVDRFIDLRVSALERWLEDLTTAPIGIRTASPQWHETLRSFVGGYKHRSQ